MEIPFYSKNDIESKPSSAFNNNKPEPVIVKIHQGYETKIKIRLVPAVEIGNKVLTTKCQSRKDTNWQNTRPLDFSESIKMKFKDANKQVVKWLGASPENGNLFLKHPVDALIKAGVQLSRPEQKELSRIFQEVSKGYILASDIDIKKIIVSTHSKGRVGNIKTNIDNKKELENDCGCK